MIENITTATPAEIDTEIAELSLQAMRVETKWGWHVEKIHRIAGMIEETRRNYRTVKTLVGEYTDARAIAVAAGDEYEAFKTAMYGRNSTLTEEERAARRAGLSKAAGRVYEVLYSGKVSEEIATGDEIRGQLYTLMTRVNALQAEYLRRGGWTRKYLVVSSNGHLHSSTACTTCRITTQFALWPQLSGLTEAEAITELGKHADALCSVCYPAAPVAAKRSNVTKAQARKISGYDL